MYIAIITALLILACAMYSQSSPRRNLVEPEKPSGIVAYNFLGKGHSHSTSIAQKCEECRHAIKGLAVESALQMLLPVNTGTYSCSDVPALYSTYSEQYTRQRENFDNYVKKVSKKIIEGHSGQAEMAAQYKFYHKISQEPWVDVICETGFNAGHSAFQWLASTANTTKLFSFDMCEYEFVKPMAEYITATFPGRFSLTCGDSTKTLPLMTNLINKCDLVIVDGGHSYDVAKADLVNFKTLANPDHHIVVLDDNPGLPSVTQAWNDAKALNMVTEIFTCSAAEKRGFSVGLYNKNAT